MSMCDGAVMDATPTASTSSAANTDALKEITALLRDVVQRLDAGMSEGLAPEAAAKFIGVSVRKLHNLNATGLLPAPARLGLTNCPRWSRCELAAWLRARTPARGKWEQIREVEMRRTA
jgi:predicted DNA-binding transcriptional regulator AlpA